MDSAGGRAVTSISPTPSSEGSKRVRIVYDHQIFWRQRYGGVSRYFFEIAERLSTCPETQVTVLAPLYVNEYLASARRDLVQGVKYDPWAPLFRFRGMANEALSWAWMRRHRSIDVVHETYFSPRRLAPRRAKVVVSVYDMIHELRPGDFPPDDPSAQRKAAAIRRADHVICISHNTRNDLLTLVNVDPGKVSVVHLGSSLRNGASADRVAPTDGRPYLLYVGDRNGYKNFSGLLAAVAESTVLRRETRIIAFGGGPITEEERAAMRELKLPQELVTQLEGSDAVLRTCYLGALALVYPSLYEGFGIPVLEAMSLDCPVICANASSLPEVAGDAAELFDVHDPGSLAVAIERVVLSEARRDELKARGRARSTMFSWDRCAAETHAVYRRVLGDEPQ